jgi:hypothetical protein
MDSCHGRSEVLAALKFGECDPRYHGSDHGGDGALHPRLHQSDVRGLRIRSKAMIVASVGMAMALFKHRFPGLPNVILKHDLLIVKVGKDRRGP